MGGGVVNQNQQGGRVRPTSRAFAAMEILSYMVLCVLKLVGMLTQKHVGLLQKMLGLQGQANRRSRLFAPLGSEAYSRGAPPAPHWP